MTAGAPVAVASRSRRLSGAVGWYRDREGVQRTLLEELSGDRESLGSAIALALDCLHRLAGPR